MPPGVLRGADAGGTRADLRFGHAHRHRAGHRRKRGGRFNHTGRRLWRAGGSICADNQNSCTAAGGNCRVPQPCPRCAGRGQAPLRAAGHGTGAAGFSGRGFALRRHCQRHRRALRFLRAAGWRRGAARRDIRLPAARPGAVHRGRQADRHQRGLRSANPRCCSIWR